MRAGLSTIQQTLTPEASAVLNRAIAEAGRRRHGQTTPLHVAAALLSSPSSHLRQACARSHPNPSSSHPLQCRALELCFSVALDRLPSSAAPASDDPPPPISNALMAALKRAQAHQRRGCPESQQQPLLAVKVELDHLLLSILDDPSVSRVMREASFSSPAVKAALLPSSPNPPPRSFYRPAAAFGDVAKVLDVLTRAKRRNPVLVGDADPGAVAGEVVARITRGDVPVGIRPVAVVSAEAEFSCGDRAEIPTKIKELAAVVEARISGGGGAVLDLGDLKWLVEGRSPAADVGRSAVAEMGRLLGQFGGRLWLIGAATCATYLRCQVYFPSMEADWDLQAVPVAPRAVGTGSNAILGSKIESFRGFPATPENLTSSSYKRSLCGDCKVGFDREVALLVREDESEKSSEAAPPGARNSLPRWLQIATAPPPTNAQKQEQELMKKWRDCCFRLHRSSSVPVTLKAPPITGFSINQAQIRLNLQPPVKTELNLGIVQKPSAGPKFIGDAASIKRLINGLLDKVSWQPEAASAVAAAVIQSNSAVGKRRNSSPKSDTWLLFAGSDRVAKRKMALALSDLVFGAPPFVIRPNSPGIVAFNDADELSASFRGQTSVDRVAEALRVNPFAAVFFEDYDQTDCALRETVKRAAERGRLVDSRGREVGLESSIFILGSGWLPEDLRNSDEDSRRSEARITELATSGRHLELQLEDDGTNKRGREWLLNDERFVKRRRDSLSIDLNLADDEACEGSWNSSDLTVEHEQDQGHGRLAIQSSVVASPCTPEVVGLMDATIVFKPMDFVPLRTRISDSVSAKFTHIMGKERSIAIDDDAVDQIAGGVWLGGETRDLFDEWFDRVLGPAFERLKDDPKFGDGAIVRLTSVNSGQQFHGKRSYLPPSVKLAVGGR